MRVIHERIMAAPTVRVAEATSHAFSTWMPLARFNQFLVGEGGNSLAQNNMFAAGMGLMIVSAVTATASSIAKFVWSKIKHLFIVTFEITSRDESYGWMIEWLNAHPLSKMAPNISVTSTYYEYDEGDKRPKLLLVPNVGSHLLRFNGKPIWLSRTKEENYPDLLSNGGSLETITLTTLRFNRSTIVALIQEAMDFARRRDEGKTIIYNGMGGHWQRFGPARAVRPLDSVILAEGYYDEILKDIDSFLKGSSWYLSRGIPYRRGYLLYGPPGSGKTSFITALAGHLRMAICVVNLNNKELNDERLTMLLNSTPTRNCIILIEDVDAAPAAVSRDQGGDNGVTLSGLLNALDGVAGQEGRLLFLTTNHMERLDHALLRPGRIDRRFHFGMADQYQIKRLFETFYPEAARDMCRRWCAAVPASKFSMAQLQGYLMYFRDDPIDAITNAGKILEYTYDYTSRPSASSSSSINDEPVPAEAGSV